MDTKSTILGASFACIFVVASLVFAPQPQANQITLNEPVGVVIPVQQQILNAYYGTHPASWLANATMVPNVLWEASK